MHSLEKIIEENNTNEIPKLSDSYIYKVAFSRNGGYTVMRGYVHLMDTHTVIMKTGRNSFDLFHIAKRDIISIEYSNKLHGDLIWRKND